MNRTKATVFILIALVLLLMPLLGACKQEAPSATPAPAPAPVAPPAQTGPTGTLTIAQTSIGKEVWLPSMGAAMEMTLVGQVYEFLIHRKPGSIELTPGLAEKWEMSKDGLTWTFYLRKGIPFHGTWGEFTAQDVKRTYEIMVNEKATSTVSPYLRANVKSVEVVNQNQAVFSMKVPTWDLAYQLSNGPTTFGIVSSKYLDAVGESKASAEPIGTGPYKFLEHKQGQYLKLEALDKHWRKVGYYKTLVFRPVPEEATRVAMLKTGEADVIEITPSVKAELEKAGFKIAQVPNAKSLGLHFGGLIFPTRPTYDASIPWVGPDPVKALKVRKAISLAINKEDIIKFVMEGLGAPIAVDYTFPDMPQTDPALKPVPYDPDQAKKLLAEAGYPDGFDVTVLSLVIPGSPEAVMLADAVAAQLQKVGLRVKVEKLEIQAYLARARDRKVGRALIPSSTIRFDEPVITNNRLVTSKVGSFFGAEDAKLDEMITRAMAELDFDKRISLQREIGKYVTDNVYWVGIASIPAILAVNKKVGDWPLLPNNPRPFYFEYITPGAK